MDYIEAYARGHKRRAHPTGLPYRTPVPACFASVWGFQRRRLYPLGSKMQGRRIVRFLKPLRRTAVQPARLSSRLLGEALHRKREEWRDIGIRSPGIIVNHHPRTGLQTGRPLKLRPSVCSSHFGSQFMAGGGRQGKGSSHRRNGRDFLEWGRYREGIKNDLPIEQHPNAGSHIRIHDLYGNRLGPDWRGSFGGTLR